MAWVYFIKSLKTGTNWIYIGSTLNLENRLKQHNLGQVKSTQFRRPYKLIYTEEYGSISEARVKEKEFKVNRSKKEDVLKDLGF